jgi:phosphoribosyl 1,2-cyclic phosphodiesterase
LIKLTFWGVRGSIPSPGPEVVRYGGNTACVEVWFDNRLFILDAGSGIRPLGLSLMQRFEKIKAFIFISHMHWDHIQGLPFFSPFRDANNAFTILGCEEANLQLEEIIADQMKSVYFPIAMSDLTANIQFQRLYEEEFMVGPVAVQTMYLNHPGNTLAYRFDYNKQALVYISDNEPFDAVNRLPLTNKVKRNNYPEDNHQRLVDFIRGADILIHDAQYFPDEYAQRVNWGHSPFTYTVDVGIVAGVRQLFLYHHDPNHSDDRLEEKLALAREQVVACGSNLNCVLARERETIELR